MRAQLRKALDPRGGAVPSLLDMSFTSAQFGELMARAQADLCALLDIPDDYVVLFLQGGASAQFSFVPLNLLGEAECADYVETLLAAAGGRCVGARTTHRLAAVPAHTSSAASDTAAMTGGTT